MPELVLQTGSYTSFDALALSPDSLLASGASESSEIQLWEVATGEQICTLSELSGHNSRMRGVNSVAFAPDGKTLASGSGDNTVKLWDVATGKEIRTFGGQTSVVFSVAFAPDGKTLASGSHDHPLKLWDVARGKHISHAQAHREEGLVMR